MNKEIGLRRLKTLPPAATPTGKLISFLLDHINRANDDLNAGKPDEARANLEYALHFANETLADSPDLLKAFYAVVCPKCGHFYPGHATGSIDICTCYDLRN